MNQTHDSVRRSLPSARKTTIFDIEICRQVCREHHMHDSDCWTSSPMEVESRIFIVPTKAPTTERGIVKNGENFKVLLELFEV